MSNDSESSILCYGSANVDDTFLVDHIVTPGETIASLDYRKFAGGKGANQAVAAAKAGATVYFAGNVANDDSGLWIKKKLESAGVRTEHLLLSANVETGHAFIQRQKDGEVAGVHMPGANHRLSRDDIDQVFKHFGPDTLLLLQNEVNEVKYMIECGHRQGMKIIFSPSPMTSSIKSMPLQHLDTLILNRFEAVTLINWLNPNWVSCPKPGILDATYFEDLLQELINICPASNIILTLSERGSISSFLSHSDGSQRRVIRTEAFNVERVVDAIGAGDVFTGYFASLYLHGKYSYEHVLKFASRAASISVTREGAMDSTPLWEEVINAGIR